MHQPVVDERIEAILERNGISPIYRPCFHVLADEGRIANADFRLRLLTCLNYQAARDEIVELLSAPYRHLHSSEPTVFQSLDLETP
jgi:hypothetical protein